MILFISIFTKTSSQSIDSILLNTNISLITCDPGDEIYSIFGHSAIRIYNKEKGFDIVYNYGTFDFNTPNFTIKFMRGQLPYRLAAYDYSRFLEEYHYFKRGVREQPLNLNIEQKRSIAAFLDINLRPENVEYMYDFFFDNCSSRIRDVFEKTLKLDTQYVSNKTLTFRDELHEYQLAHPWINLGIDMIIGSIADRNASPRNQMFLPDYLHDILANTKLGQNKLLQPSYEVLSYANEKEIRNKVPFFRPFTLNIFLMLITLTLIYFKKQNWINKLAWSWYLIAGIGGLVIIFLWFFTDHIATKANWNLLWLNPLFFVLLLKESVWRSRVKYVLMVTSIVALLNSLVSFIPQDMPFLSCIVPAFVWMLLKEWGSNFFPLKKSA